MLNQQIAQNIKRQCREKRISVSAMLKTCGINQNLIYEMENKDKSPRIDTLVKIADYLDCSLDWLAGRQE